MHKVAIIHLKIQNKSIIVTNSCMFDQPETSSPDLDFAHEVSQIHVILNNEVCVQTFGGDAVLLL